MLLLTLKTPKSTDIQSENNQNLPEINYQIDIENSQIKWIGKKVTSSHDGFVNIKSGNISMKGNQVTSGNIVVDMNSIYNTDIKNEEYSNKLTGHLKNEDFFNVDSFPTSFLNINKSEKIEGSRYRYFGDLTIKGITNPIEFEGSISQSEDKYSANINLSFDRTLWKIHYGSGKFFDDLGDRMILDYIDLEILIIAK